MSQTDMDIAVADANTGTTFRIAINAALKALASLSSGVSEPSTTYAFQLWADTATSQLKMRNSLNNAWIYILDLTNGIVFKGDALVLRFNDTGADGKEWGIRSDGGKIEIVENTGTEGVPVWASRASSFSAHKNGVAQNTSAGVYTKVTFGTEAFDNSGDYDAANSKIIPADTRARRIHGVINISSNQTVVGNPIMIAIYKNGVLLKEFIHMVAAAAENRSLAFDCIDVPNGTTDYYEIYVYADSQEAIAGSITRTFLEGSLAE